MGEKNSIQYYEKHAKNFAQDTVDINMDDFYLPFLEAIQTGGHILDLGCGSGRDSLYFKNKGFRITAVDASGEMCREAEKILGQPVCESFIEDYQTEEVYDGIWACASLLHVCKKDMKQCIIKLFQMLKDGGVLYASWQYGQSERQVESRYYSDFTEEQILGLFGECQECEVLKCWQSPDVLQLPPITKRWVNVLVKKR